MKEKVAHICVPSGIGDFSWVYSKFVNLGRDLQVSFCSGGPPRLQPFLDLLPKVVGSSAAKLSFPALRKRALPSNTTREEVLRRVDAGEMLYVEANTHLEAGRRIEEWMPGLDVDHHYEIQFSDEHIKRAVKVAPRRPFVCIFAASRRGAENWRGWLAREWVEFLSLFNQTFGETEFVLVGAGWDKTLGDEIVEGAQKNGIRLKSQVGELHIGETLHVISLSRYFVSFPSGLGILANVLQCPATMFYPVALSKMIGSWADPESIESTLFHERLFPKPLSYIRWLRDVYQMETA